MPKQEKIKSALVTASGEFRVGMVQTLNTLGFTAEKVSCENFTALGKLLATDTLVWNVVVDAASLFPSDPQLKERISDLERHLASAAVSVIVYLTAERLDASTEMIKAFPKFHFRPLPVRRQDVVDYFIKPYMARHGHGKGEKAPAKPQASQSGESIGEAIEHVKQTIEHLKKIAADVAAVDQFVAIGQRFNGLYGAYLFLGGKEGYHHLRILCEVIDSLSKTYLKDPKPTALAKPHVDHMVRSAKCVFGILKEMRAGQGVSAALKAEADDVRKVYDAMPDVFRREAMSQEFVDEILRKYSA